MIECVVTKCAESLLPVLEQDFTHLHLEDDRDIDVILQAFKLSPDAIITDCIHSFTFAKDVSIKIKAQENDHGYKPLLFLKVTSKQAVIDIQLILPFVDGIICDRRKLTSLTHIFRQNTIQKRLTACCNIAGKPIICSGDILHSMVFFEIPTRAEICDVAYAVLDGCDGVLLGYTSAFGDRPLDTLKQLDAIAHEAQRCQLHQMFINSVLFFRVPGNMGESEVLALSIVEATIESTARLIIVVDKENSDKKLMQAICKYRPPALLVWISKDVHTCRRCFLYRGCRSLWVNEQILNPSTDILHQIKAMAWLGATYGQTQCHLLENDDIVIVRPDLAFKETFNVKVVKFKRVAQEYHKKYD
ncbi:hypothetical protein ACOME3_003891 [Neoechinorhynchus agilis]